MNQDEWVRRGSSFGAVAGAYAQYRPDYPEAAVRWCLAPAGPDISALRVLDLGAGTGKLTAALAGLGADVTAVEPDESMRGEFARRLPSQRVLPGSAEAIPLPGGSVDAVLCGQAMHWFNLDLALPEIARVLVPGGVLAGLWNNDDDRVAWVAGLQAAAEGTASPSLSVRRAEAAGFDTKRFAPHSFTPPERAEFPNAQRHTTESLVATVATHSKLLVMPASERDRLLTQVRNYLATTPETSGGEFTLPMVTTVLRTTTKAAG